MTDLLLRRVSSSRPAAQDNEDYDVIGPQEFVIGRIFNSIASPPETPWAWTLAHGFHEDRSPTHGYEPTRETAMQAFARSWHRET
jgi:hypothetical protein